MPLNNDNVRNVVDQCNVNTSADKPTVIGPPVVSDTQSCDDDMFQVQLPLTFSDSIQQNVMFNSKQQQPGPSLPRPSTDADLCTEQDNLCHEESTNASINVSGTRKSFSVEKHDCIHHILWAYAAWSGRRLGLSAQSDCDRCILIMNNFLFIF